MVTSGPVTTQYPPSLPHISSAIIDSRDHFMTDQNYNRTAERPSLTALDTQRSPRRESASFSHFNLIKREATRENNPALRGYYDPIQDRGEPPFSRQEHRQEPKASSSKMQGRSPESTRSTGSREHNRLPPISQLTFGFESHVRSSERPSPPSAYPAQSPISLSQPFPSPYPPVAGSQQYHSVYSESSSASTHNTLSPRDRYPQAGSSGSPAQYEAPRYRETPGHTPITDMRTPISASTQATFSPMSNERSPATDQRPFSQDGLSPPLHSLSGAQGGYQCTHEQCIDRPPFQTQYLLSSHQNVHKPDRPYYCQKPDCARSKNGKPNSGFKRKNELIRHQLVHNSPGYACPFCPDRDHKYPRPDNLQRHVKVHHMDKAKDDPELRAILAQRIDSDKAGRRRRVNSTS